LKNGDKLKIGVLEFEVQLVVSVAERLNPRSILFKRPPHGRFKPLPPKRTTSILLVGWKTKKKTKKKN